MTSLLTFSSTHMSVIHNLVGLYSSVSVTVLHSGGFLEMSCIFNCNPRCTLYLYLALTISTPVYLCLRGVALAWNVCTEFGFAWASHTCTDFCSSISIDHIDRLPSYMHRNYIGLFH